MAKLEGQFKPDRYVHMLFRQLPGAIWTTDCDLRLTYVAGRLANDMTPRAKAGMSLYDVLGSRDAAPRVIASHLAAISGEPQSFEQEGNGRWYAVFIDQLCEDTGEVAGSIGAAFDITEQRTMQERLARSEALLAQAQRVAHIGTFEWEIPSNVVTWSDELHRIYGLAPGEFSGSYEAFLKYVHPSDLERIKSAILDALTKCSPLVYEHRIVRPDGTVRVLHARSETIADKAGHPARMLGCCWDVTELRETMDKLERARSLLTAAIEATADGLIVVDRSGTVTLRNHRFLTLSRIPQDLAAEDDVGKLLSYLSEQIKDPQQFLNDVLKLRSHPELERFNIQHFKDGRVYEGYSGPQRIGNEIVGRVWSFRDITERENLLSRNMFLADATRLLGTLDIEPALGSVAQLAVPLLADGCAIHLLGNGQPRRLLFASREGAESLSPELQGSVVAGHSTIYSIGTRPYMAVPIVVKRGVAGAITFVGQPMGRYGKADLEFAEALALRAALSVENARLYRSAREALQARDEFLTIAAHEIRGPLTSLHLAVQALRKGKAPESARPKLLGLIEREDRRLARFMDELVDFGKAQSGQIYFNFEEVDLGEIVREAASTIAADLAQSGSALSITTEGQPTGQWDKTGLTHVATNLLSNAIKFGEGKPIAVTVREDGDRTVLQVKDHGAGIQPEMISRLFNPFERGVSVRNYGGLGLGLFIARTIVEGLGGVIRVESALQQGSTFIVELPNSGTT